MVSREDRQEREVGTGNWEGAGMPVLARYITIQQWPSLLTHEAHVIYAQVADPKGRDGM